MVAKWAVGVSIDSLMRNVEPAPSGQPFEFALCRIPGKARPDFFIVPEIRRNRPAALRFFDGLVDHRAADREKRVTGPDEKML